MQIIETDSQHRRKARINAEHTVNCEEPGGGKRIIEHKQYLLCSSLLVSVNGPQSVPPQMARAKVCLGGLVHWGKWSQSSSLMECKSKKAPGPGAHILIFVMPSTWWLSTGAHGMIPQRHGGRAPTSVWGIEQSSGGDKLEERIL